MTSSAVVGSSAMRSLPRDQRHRDHHALTHAAGKLVRPRAQASLFVLDTHELEHGRRARSRVVPRDPLVDSKRLDDLVADAHEGVQRRHGVLEDHRDRLAADASKSLGAAGQQVHPIERSRSLLDAPGRRRDQTQQRQIRHGLPGPRFADDADGLARFDAKRHAVHRAHDTLARVETGRQAVYVQQRHVNPSMRARRVRREVRLRGNSAQIA